MHVPLHFRLCSHFSYAFEEQTLDGILLFMTVDVIVQKAFIKQMDRTFQL